MKRKFDWLVPVIVAVGLVAYFVVWPWYRDRAAGDAADALIAELNEHGAQIGQRVAALPPVPDNPTKTEITELVARVARELDEMSSRNRELSERAKEVLPKTPAGRREELRQALDQYTARVGQALDVYKERGSQLRIRMEAFKGKGKAGE